MNDNSFVQHNVIQVFTEKQDNVWLCKNICWVQVLNLGVLQGLVYPIPCEIEISIKYLLIF